MYCCRGNWPYIVNTYRTMGNRIAAIIDAAATPAGKGKQPPVPVITARGPSESEDSDLDASDHDLSSKGGDQDQQVAEADVHIDHLALAASIQMQAEGLFRMPPEKRKKVNDLQVGRKRCLP